MSIRFLPVYSREDGGAVERYLSIHHIRSLYVREEVYFNESKYYVVRAVYMDSSGNSEYWNVSPKKETREEGEIYLAYLIGEINR